MIDQKDQSSGVDFTEVQVPSSIHDVVGFTSILSSLPDDAQLRTQVQIQFIDAALYHRQNSDLQRIFAFKNKLFSPHRIVDVLNLMVEQNNPDILDYYINQDTVVHDLNGINRVLPYICNLITEQTTVAALKVFYTHFQLLLNPLRQKSCGLDITPVLQQMQFPKTQSAEEYYEISLLLVEFCNDAIVISNNYAIEFQKYQTTNFIVQLKSLLEEVQHIEGNFKLLYKTLIARIIGVFEAAMAYSPTCKHLLQAFSPLVSQTFQITKSSPMIMQVLVCAVTEMECQTKQINFAWDIVKHGLKMTDKFANGAAFECFKRLCMDFTLDVLCDQKDVKQLCKSLRKIHDQQEEQQNEIAMVIEQLEYIDKNAKIWFEE